MPKHPVIPIEMHADIQKLIDEFNGKHFKEAGSRRQVITGIPVNRGYTARFKGKFLYLDRFDHIGPSPICRLTWMGAMDKWEFAIFKYSDGVYDPDEWFFPGIEKVNGTVTGAMEAGMEAYPI
jgi:hypothetical protein